MLDSIRALTHIGVCVSDMDRSVAFYRDVLGFRYQRELRVDGPPTEALLQVPGAKLHAVYLERDGFCIELLRFEEPGSPFQPPARKLNDLGFTHLSLQVSDVDEVAAWLASRGAVIDPGTRIEIGGAVVAIFLRDPDGLPIELVRARTA